MVLAALEDPVEAVQAVVAREAAVEGAEVVVAVEADLAAVEEGSQAVAVVVAAMQARAGFSASARIAIVTRSMTPTTIRRSTRGRSRSTARQYRRFPRTTKILAEIFKARSKFRIFTTVRAGQIFS